MNDKKNYADAIREFEMHDRNDSEGYSEDKCLYDKEEYDEEDCYSYSNDKHDSKKDKGCGCDECFLQGVEEGYEEGIEEGYRKGCKKGYEKGCREGYEKGYEKAKREVIRYIKNKKRRCRKCRCFCKCCCRCCCKRNK